MEHIKLIGACASLVLGLAAPAAAHHSAAMFDESKDWYRQRVLVHRRTHSPRDGDARTSTHVRAKSHCSLRDRLPN
jgi:hypothetical protein